MNKEFILGITGSIGAGKSKVLSILEEFGFYVFSADDLVREHYNEKKEFYRAVVDLLGSGILNEDSSINTKKIIEIIKKDNAKFRELNKLTETIIVKNIKERIDDFRGRKRLIACEAPLLFEMGMQDIFDSIISVISDDKLILERLLSNRDIDIDTYEFIKRNQIEDKKRIELSDYVIYNRGTTLDLRDEVKKFLEFKGVKYQK